MTIKEYKKICDKAFKELSAKDRAEVIWQSYLKPLLDTSRRLGLTKEKND